MSTIYTDTCLGKLSLSNRTVHWLTMLMKLLQRETFDFIPPGQTYGHLTAPHLNPVDYMVWGAMEQRVY